MTKNKKKMKWLLRLLFGLKWLSSISERQVTHTEGKLRCDTIKRNLSNPAARGICSCEACDNALAANEWVHSADPVQLTSNTAVLVHNNTGAYLDGRITSQSFAYDASSNRRRDEYKVTNTEGEIDSHSANGNGGHATSR